MVQGKVIGSIVSTQKVESLVGFKFMVVKLDYDGGTLVAVDTVGAGIGERVLVSTGSPARLAVPSHSYNAPVDAAIVGIIDKE